MAPTRCSWAEAAPLRSAGDVLTSIPNDAQVCSCNNVSKEQICAAIREKDLCSVDEVKACTRAGTGCGGCLPLVTDLFKAQIKATGKKVSNSRCVNTLPAPVRNCFRSSRSSTSRRSTS